MSAVQKHPYHLVDPSPWPLIGASAGLLLAFSAVTFMHPDIFGAETGKTLKTLGYWKLAPGFVLVFLTMFFWWRDVIAEGEHLGYHTPVVQLGLRYGMLLFIASEVLFFAAFFWAFFDASLFATEAHQYARVEANGGQWPPKGVEPFNPFDLPLMNTLILLLSGTTVTWAHHALQHGDRKGLINGLIVTVILGLCFTGLQAYEYAHAAFGFRDNIYSSTFFMATGFHGFHVIIGTIFLFVCLMRAIKGHFKPDHHFGFEAAAWYWHFVDVVWLFLFIAVYIWGAGGAEYAAH
ncbi:MAG: cytochrome c oxidase subunit [Alphaproteobacteria bacterium]|jgi:cytochrome c oxidase subunit 3|nr:cytochrome c oxidase subunit [Alphaproteobacteria bacterium]